MARNSKGKSVLLLGPWPGGMNTRDDPTEISDTELTEIVNFDVESTGALIPRRGWQEVAVTPPAYKITPLGIYHNTYAQNKAMFARAVNTNAGTEQTAFFNLAEGVYEDNKNLAGGIIYRTGLFAAAINMNKSVYFVPDYRSQASPVGFRITSMGDANPDDVPAMPAGQFAFVLNDRAFVFNPDSGRLYWSKATDPTVWMPPDGGYVDIDPSDEPFTDCVLVRTTAYFIRSSGIYAFTFTSDPGIDGIVASLANSEGALMGVAYQNELYLATPRGLFKFLNGYMTLVSDKITLGAVAGPPSYSDFNGMTIIEHTLWVRSWDGEKLNHYAFNLRTGAASKYDHTNVSEIYGRSVSDTEFTYLSTGAGVAVFTNQRTPNRVTAGGKSMGYSFVSKRITLGTRLVWKRLLAWLSDYTAGPHFYGGNNSTKFFVRVGSVGEFNIQDTYTGNALVTANGISGRIDTPSLRFKDVQFGMETNQIGAVNPNGYGADAGLTIRNLMMFYSASREAANIQA